MSTSHVKSAPAQVVAQAAAAEAAHKKLYSVPPAGDPALGVQPAPSVGEGNEPVIVPEGAPPQPSAAAPTAPPAAPPAAPPIEQPVAPPAEPPQENWEQKFRTLEGKYRAEVPALRGKVDSLESLITTLQAPVVAPSMPTIGGDPVEDDEKLARLREEFGDDFVDVITRHAMRRIEPQFQQLQDQVAEYNQRLESTRVRVAQTAQEQMYEYMDREVANWKAINRSPEFIEWLRQVDDFAGIPRGALLQDAYDKNDGPRLARFFLTFGQEQTAIRGDAQPPSGLPAQPTPRPSLETFAAPGRAAPAATPASAPQQGRVWTRQEILNFYAQKRRGELSKQQVDEIERDIFQAGVEGRVRG